MSKEFLTIIKNPEIGNISLNKSVFEELVVSVLAEDEEISVNRKDITCHLEEDRLVIEVGIKVLRGLNFTAKGEEVQEAVFKQLRNFTGQKPAEVNVNINGFFI